MCWIARGDQMPLWADAGWRERVGVLVARAFKSWLGWCCCWCDYQEPGISKAMYTNYYQRCCSWSSLPDHQASLPPCQCSGCALLHVRSPTFAFRSPTGRSAQLLPSTSSSSNTLIHRHHIYFQRMYVCMIVYTHWRDASAAGVVLSPHCQHELHPACRRYSR